MSNSPDFNVHRVRVLLREREVRVVAPDGECLGDLLVHIPLGQSLRVLGDAVRERLHLPAASLQRVTLRPGVRAEADPVLNTAPWHRHQLHRFRVQLARHVQSGKGLELLHRLDPRLLVQEAAIRGVPNGRGQVAKLC